jgi:hypothetical protein
MDIKDITQHAKEALLTNKQHAPTFFVERKDKQLDILLLDWLEDTTSEKSMQCFSIGAKMTQERQWKIEEIKEILFICEAWTSFQRAGEPRKYERPSDDPARKEVLMVARLEIVPSLLRNKKPTLHTTMQIIEMLRDGSGDLVDLLVDPEVRECNRHLILEAFLAGIASASLTMLSRR